MWSGIAAVSQASTRGRERLTRQAAARLCLGGDACDLRACAINDSVAGMLETATTTELDRQRFAAVGRALSDPKRLCVLESLANGELSVGDLSSVVGCQVPNMSQHLAVLRTAGLVTTRREGSTVFYRLADPRVLEAYRLIQTIAR